MMQASCYGRLAADPKPISTKTGKPMTVATMAVDIGDDGDAPLWVGVVAFGRVAEDLERHGKGDLLSVSGRVQRKNWTDREGNTRESLQVIADALVSARTVRPSGGRKKTEV